MNRSYRFCSFEMNGRTEMHKLKRRANFNNWPQSYVISCTATSYNMQPLKTTGLSVQTLYGLRVRLDCLLIVYLKIRAANENITAKKHGCHELTNFVEFVV